MPDPITHLTTTASRVGASLYCVAVAVLGLYLSLAVRDFERASSRLELFGAWGAVVAGPAACVLLIGLGVQLRGAAKAAEVGRDSGAA